MLLTLLGLGLVPAGAAVGWLNGQRDDDGYLTTGTESIGTPTAALTTKGIAVRVEGPDWLYAPERLGTTRVHARSTTGKPLLVGVARDSDVAGWLRGVAHDQVRDVSVAPFSVSYLRQPGELASAPAPTGQRFWAAATSGAGDQTLTWRVSEGRWAVVIANADGTPGIDARVRLAAQVPGLASVAAGLTVAGIAALALGVLLIVHGARGGRNRRTPLPTPGPTV